MLKKLFRRKPDFQRLFSEYPPGVRYTLLLHYVAGNLTLSLDDIIALRKVYSAIENTFVGRNLQGGQLEKAGKTAEALALYEANLRDVVDTPFPYRRLRIIYTKQKKYQDAIRVCYAYLAAIDQHAEAARNPSLALRSREEYEGWIEKLKEKIQT